MSMFALYHEGIIWAVGATDAEVRGKADEDLGTGWAGKIMPISDDLAREVERRGGDLPHRVVDGELVLAD